MGNTNFFLVFFLRLFFCCFSSWGQEVKPSYPFAKWKDSSFLKAELISERLKCFTLAFLIAVKCSDVSPQEGFSLGFFPDGVGWNFPSNSAGKKINFEKKQDWPQEQHLAKVGDSLPRGGPGEEAVPGRAERSPSPTGTPQPEGSCGSYLLFSKHPFCVRIWTCFLKVFWSIRFFAVSAARLFPFSLGCLWDGRCELAQLHFSFRDLFGHLVNKYIRIYKTTSLKSLLVQLICRKQCEHVLCLLR